MKLLKTKEKIPGFDKAETHRFILWRTAVGRKISEWRTDYMPDHREWWSREEYVSMYKQGLTPVDVSNRFYSEINR